MAEEKEKTFELAIIAGCEGKCISLNNFRIAGPKPCGGGKIIQKWDVKWSTIQKALPEIDLTAQ